MKLIYISNLRLPTEKAYGIQITKMCEAFARLGLQVELLIPRRKNPSDKSIFEYYGIKKTFSVKHVPSFDFYLPGRLDKPAVLIKNLWTACIMVIYSLFNNSEVIYSRDELPLYLLSFFKKNLYFEAHKFSIRRKLFYNRFKKINLKLITISQGLKDEFIGFGYPPSKVLVAHDGFDPEEFNSLITAKVLREQFGLSDNKPVVAYIGHLYHHKGADILAEAAKILGDITFVFVGGTEEDLVDFRAKFTNIRNVFIIGQRTHQEALSFMMMADVLVLPNKEESGHTSPMKLFEYMAAGKPIVASNTEAIREILNPNNSVLVSPGSPEQLATATKRVLSDKELSIMIARQAFSDVQEYTWQKRAEKILNFIHV